MNSLSGIEYSPLDMAEYIFWTGDEKGVALTIEEFLEQGLMTRQEAINFLQSIKFNLDFMQSHYQGLQKMDDKISNKARNLKQELQSQKKAKTNYYEERPNKEKLISFELERPKSESFEILPGVSKIKEMSFEERPNLDQEYSAKRSKNTIGIKSGKKMAKEISLSDEEYEEILERLKVADSLYKEYSLEKVIFQLAKVMFSQSLTKGNKEAQKALQNFTAFLQNEVEQGQISNNLKRKILDVLISALMDALMEHPELVSAAKEELQSMTDLNSPSSVMLRELLMPEVGIRPEGKSSTKELDEKPTLTGKEMSSQGSLEKIK